MSRVAVVALVGGLAAACSDSSRLSGNPFSNPFNSGHDVDQTASIQPLAQPQYAAPQAVAPVPSVSSQPLQPVANAAGGGWTAAGGTSITVAQGDSLTTISNRYGVPTNAILSANGLTSPSQVVAGRAIVIPVYSVNAPAARVAAAPAETAGTAPRVASAAPAKTFAPLPPTPPAIIRAPAQNLANVKQTADAKLAAQQKATQNALQKPGKALAAKETTLNAKAQQVTGAKIQAEQTKVATVQKLQQPVQSATFEQPVKAAAAPAPAAHKDADQTASLQSAGKSEAEFRWPAKGRIISGFGSGNSNEGINISLPEGTSVRAAESGTVTFAGDDVKSYGNLVLIKHDNGYVSAYAHNGKLTVKRGDRVTRGQEIAKSGQTGDVTSPQLHFEIRKGAKPVDPVPYLGG